MEEKDVRDKELFEGSGFISSMGKRSWQILLLELDLFNPELYPLVSFWGIGLFLLKCWGLREKMGR